MDIYKRIKDLRKDNDMTQKEVANALNMQVTQYRRYETGERAIPIDIAVSLAEFYEVSLDYLAGLTNINYSIDNNKMGKEEKSLVTIFQRLNPANKIRVIERAETLLENQKR